MTPTATLERESVRELLIRARCQFSDGQLLEATGTVQEAATRLDEVADEDRETCGRLLTELTELFTAVRDELVSNLTSSLDEPATGGAAARQTCTNPRAE